MPGLTGNLTRPNKLSPAERGVRSGIASRIAREGAASVNQGIRATINADAQEREALLTQYEVAGQDVPQELIEQLDLRSELRRETATFEAADGAVAAQYTKQFDPIVMAENARILDSNIGELSRDITSQDAKIIRKGKLLDLVKKSTDLQQTQVETQGKVLDNTLKQYEASQIEITTRMDDAFGGVGTSELMKMIGDGRMAAANVPLADAHRYVAKRRKADIDLQIQEMNLRKGTAQARDAEAKLRTSKTAAGNAAKQQLLLGMNTEELTAMSRVLRSTGSQTIDGVTFNQVDVANALETVHTSGGLGREIKLQSFKTQMDADALVTSMNRAGFMMNAIYGGGGDAYATMTIDDIDEQRAQLANEAAELMPNDTTGQSAYVEEKLQLHIANLQSKMVEIEKAALARTPENARPALLDITTRGYINDSGTANLAAVENLSSFATMEKGSFYSDAGRTMFNAVTKPQTAAVGDEGTADISSFFGNDDKKKAKLTANDIASAVSNPEVNRNMTSHFTGRVAQAGAISAFGFASVNFEPELREELGNLLFDGVKQGLKQTYVLNEGEDIGQINWDTVVPLVIDTVAAARPRDPEDSIAELQNFFDVMALDYVNPTTKSNVIGAAKPNTMAEHQVWANVRMVNDAIVPFSDQIGQFLTMDAAELTKASNKAMADYALRLEAQETNRVNTAKRNERDRQRAGLGHGNSGGLGLNRPILSDTDFAQRNNQRLSSAARERAAAAAGE